ncbi:hypothetical protein C8J56DRAFT_961467 [Mycena floridula]|nr:hypothetical protein C8J56DRAFT_961467 [Mycena floridula]
MFIPASVWLSKCLLLLHCIKTFQITHTQSLSTYSSETFLRSHPSLMRHLLTISTSSPAYNKVFNASCFRQQEVIHFDSELSGKPPILKLKYSAFLLANSVSVAVPCPADTPSACPNWESVLTSASVPEVGDVTALAPSLSPPTLSSPL